MTKKNDIRELLNSIAPKLNPGEYVFASVNTAEAIDQKDVISSIQESEGVSVVISKTKADLLQLKYDFVAAWITLTVHSSLNAVGLTAAFSNELAKHDISCNVVAGFYHDHIFVNKIDSERAMEILNQLSRTNSAQYCATKWHNV
ncbi:ACT domain-containing protein [Flavobacteriales bacterium]|nr:ACT domain-containing protein [Flavobacteriales bacterium]